MEFNPVIANFGYTPLSVNLHKLSAFENTVPGKSVILFSSKPKFMLTIINYCMAKLSPSLFKVFNKQLENLRKEMACPLKQRPPETPMPDSLCLYMAQV